MVISSLRGYHHYTEREITKIMEKDFDTAKMFEQDDAISTASNKIEFLLDSAEVRLRDTVVCGWNFQKDGALEKCLTMIVNGYFFEMVRLMAQFFDSKTMNNMQGNYSTCLNMRFLHFSVFGNGV